ncbi:tRNA lysidine(34) synthetase TilS [Haliea sp. E17]|uniref:tRNA lysidine(34) synthetase TilS n=1 Tax=Haliea sp. E17 TaxID=3401576 RepID=UPI003AAB6891
MTLPREFVHLESALAAASAAPRWFVAFSGGLDSTVLLHLLSRWQTGREAMPELCALHINHQLQDAAADWAEHCRVFCQGLGVPLRVLEATVTLRGKGLEAAAREARYALLAGQLGPGEVLFTAHHLDDQVETFFLRLLRGAGIEGLSAMPAQRALGKGSLVRPLLACSREQLEDYARRHQLPWVDDPSNADPALDRNFLRREVLPRFGERWPAYRQAVARAATHMAEARSRLLQGLPPVLEVASALGDPGIELTELLDQDPATAAALLREWLRGLGCAAPDQSLLAEFLRQLRESSAEANPLLDAGDYRLQRYRGSIYLLPEEGALPDGLTLVPGAGAVTVGGVGELALRPCAAGFCLRPGESVDLRWRRGGERCRPLGRSAGASLKQLAQEAGVPPWWRSRLPLVYLGDELLAVGGLGSCHSSRSGATGEALEARWELYWNPAIQQPAD